MSQPMTSLSHARGLPVLDPLAAGSRAIATFSRRASLEGNPRFNCQPCEDNDIVFGEVAIDEALPITGDHSSRSHGINISYFINEPDWRNDRLSAMTVVAQYPIQVLVYLTDGEAARLADLDGWDRQALSMAKTQEMMAEERPRCDLQEQATRRRAGFVTEHGLVTMATARQGEWEAVGLDGTSSRCATRPRSPR